MLRKSKEIVNICCFKLIIILFVTYNAQTDDATNGDAFVNLNEKHKTMFHDYLIQYGKDAVIDPSNTYLEAFGIFTTNLVLLDYYKTKYSTTSFGVNRYTGMTFDRFVKGYTGFNSDGLTDEGVVQFDPASAPDIPIFMDWTKFLTRYGQPYCRNSYAFSATSKYYTFASCK